MAFENLKSTGIRYLLEKLKTVFLQIADAVKSVNGELPDADGDITINSVPYAQNLESEASHLNTDTFAQRTTGGDSSVGNGDAWLMIIRGNSVHDGFVPEELNMIVTATGEEPITAVLDRDAFVAAVSESGTITLVYSSSWSADPGNYGVTVTGEPSAGDTIVITYVKEERGTIYVSDPQSFVSTGWNLFDYANGYARVVKYDHGYMVSGAYTALKFSVTPTGTQSNISVTDGHFDVPSDGYVHVTGGNQTTTAIFPTWEDWTDGYEGDYEGYSASVIDLTAVMSAHFPYGLLRVGSAADEIDLNLGQVISRVERLSYTEENLAAAKASGREFDYDENFIYLALASASTASVSLSGSVSTDDHGVEYFTGTDVPVYAEILYGANLKNKLERDVLTISGQVLSASQQKQARENIGAGDAAAVNRIAQMTTVSGISTLAKLTTALNNIMTGLSAGGLAECVFSPTASFGQFKNGTAYYAELRKYSSTAGGGNIYSYYRRQNIIATKSGTSWTFTETNGRGIGSYPLQGTEALPGFVTGSGANLQFFAPMTINPTVAGASLSISNMIARGVDGYITSGMSDFTGVTITAVPKPEGIVITMAKSSGTWGTNNTPASVQLSGTLTLS